MAKPRVRQYPNQGTITIADGDQHVIERGGTFVRVRKADAEFKLLLDDDVENIAQQDNVFKMTEGDSFKKVTVVNDTGAPLTFQLEIGRGEVTSNAFSISDGVGVRNDAYPNDELQIKTKAGTQLLTYDAIQDAYMSVITKAMRESSGYQDYFKKPKTPVGGSKFSLFSTAGVQTIISPAANVNGAIIRTLNCNITSGGNIASIFADTAAPSGWNDATKACIYNVFGSSVHGYVVSDIYLPAGVGLYGAASTTWQYLTVTYDLI